MYRHIINDFFLGLCNSIRIDLVAIIIIDNIKLRKLMCKICKYNFLMHLLPFVFGSLFDIYFFHILKIPINIFSMFFHLVHYLDLISIASTYSQKTYNSSNALDSISLAITMTIYNLMIYFTTMLIDIIFYNNFYIIAMVIKFLILTIYHSFYCFDNLWQHKKIKMVYRVDMHEKLWPYYMGYGTLATVLFIYTPHPAILIIYNLYMMFAITLPFILVEKYPKTKELTYPSINISVFSQLLGIMFKASKNLLGFDSLKMHD